MSLADRAPGLASERAVLAARIRQVRLEAEDVLSFDFEALHGALPAWTPGAHVDLHLPSGRERQYSLCSRPDDPFWRIAVLHQPDGRGGSREVHAALRPGQVATLGLPRNTFRMARAERLVFVAGGIGITPILPMAEAAEAAGVDWHLHYCGRSRGRMAFLDRIAALPAARVTLRSDDCEGRPDIAALVAGSQGAAVHACGPAPMLEALEAAMAAAGRQDAYRQERFSAAPAALPGDGTIRVHLHRSGGHVDVPPGQTLLAALHAAGVNVPCSCEQGFCGTCETRVIAGVPDHRDMLLSEAERERGDVMFPCVSRAQGPEITLDL